MSAVRKWIERRRPSARTATHGPIGVCLTRDNLHLVQLEAKGGGIRLRSCQSLPYPGTRSELLASQSAVHKLVRRAMRAGKFRGRQVVSALPPEAVRVMSVSYPHNPQANEAASIATVMKDRLDGDLSEYVIDYVPIRSSSRDGERLALVAVSRLEDVNEYLDCLAAAGLHIDSLEIGPLALKRLIEWAPGIGREDKVIAINVTEAASHLTMISGQRLLSDQEVTFSEDSVLEAIAKSLNLSTPVARDLVLTHGLDPKRKWSGTEGAESGSDVTATLVEIVKPEFLKLVREIDRAFLFADSESRGNGQKRIVLIGDMVRWPKAVELLGSLTQIPVQILGLVHMPFADDTASLEQLDDQSAAEMSTAIGLALRGMAAHA